MLVCRDAQIKAIDREERQELMEVRYPYSWGYFPFIGGEAWKKALQRPL